MSFDADFEARLRTRLDPLDALAHGVARSDFDLNPNVAPDDVPLTPAAVLVPIIRRARGYTMLLTLRTSSMPTHAGQVSFPGGRIQADDEGPVSAALRETLEETGLSREFIAPVGGFGTYRTGTNYRITPVVALVEPGFELKPDPREVDDVFETPVAFLMDAANHERHAREWQGRRREYYAMPWEGRYIWGATAGMIKALHQRLYEDDF
ncbi:MAG: CoA pyrophosphatase [Hyphomonadaceae bacterium]|nr:MAG: NUDIX hydrolase domain [Caulobacteraceae bacterium]MBT9446826.1 CoA pyrophosphatase [Hyphomonadaceae bacterium]TPW03082.1 MAG: NUDIX hydrolase domain [Alphaproteobacteria bacterium]